MTHVVIVGAGPAGFQAAAHLLAANGSDVTIDLLDRADRPDALLRHGPAAGRARLTEVARAVDAVLDDTRVRFLGGVDVGSDVPLDGLRRTADAVVLASGSPVDQPLEVEGNDSVGIGTISHLQAWLAGNPDVAAEELDLRVDSAVLIGWSRDTLALVDLLERREAPDSAPTEVRERLAQSGIRQVAVVQPDSETAVDDPHVQVGLRPIGVVGRNRARALRTLAPRNADGLRLVKDVRAQLLLRPRGRSEAWSALDHDGDVLARDGVRALASGAPVPGLYVVGWAGRPPSERVSHADDAAALVQAVLADRDELTPPTETLADLLNRLGVTAHTSAGWSAVAATDVLLDRFEGEGTLPLADYDELLEQVDED